jgi:hypothetical protein
MYRTIGIVFWFRLAISRQLRWYDKVGEIDGPVLQRVKLHRWQEHTRVNIIVQSECCFRSTRTSMRLGRNYGIPLHGHAVVVADKTQLPSSACQQTMPRSWPGQGSGGAAPRSRCAHRTLPRRVRCANADARTGTFTHTYAMRERNACEATRGTTKMRRGDCRAITHELPRWARMRFPHVKSLHFTLVLIIKVVRCVNSRQSFSRYFVNEFYGAARRQR